MSLSARDFERAQRDPAVFADLLVGEPLWPHQLEVVASSARYRVLCAGRRAGKTRVFGVLALHQAFAVPRSRVLIVSATETAAKRMFADIAGMAAAAPLLRGSVADESTSRLTLSSGSLIECVPASMGQVRSAEADLLILDEAGFIQQALWEAAEPTILARPGSRVLICSTPWGGADHFFRVLWRQGMDAPDGRLRSWHWPSTVSPLVDEQLLEDIKGRSSPLYFAREYLAEFVDEAGAYFRSEELTAAVDDDLVLIDPVVDPEAAARLGGVVGGVDWGGRRDAHALTVVAGRAEPDGRGRRVWWVPFVEERFDLGFDGWIDRLVDLSRGFAFLRLSSEENGVGMAPTGSLSKALWQAGARVDVVVPVTTTARLKEDAFGFIRLLLQQGRLRLPRHPGLLKQLGALEYAMTDTGLLRIAVPERAGHDDLAMSLALAVLPLISDEVAPAPDPVWVDMDDLVWDDEDDPMAYVRGMG